MMYMDRGKLIPMVVFGDGDVGIAIGIHEYKYIEKDNSFMMGKLSLNLVNPGEVGRTTDIQKVDNGPELHILFKNARSMDTLIDSLQELRELLEKKSS